MLSLSAQKTIHDYLNLPFPGIIGVRCPYFNNARRRQRGELRALIGKGSPQEIVDEATLISIQYHTGLFDKSGCCAHHDGPEKPRAEEIRKFLIDRDLGVDCSGFVTQVLKKHFEETKGIDLPRLLYKKPAGLLHRLINYLRPIENIGVKTYANDRNTEVVREIKDIRPGDLIIALEGGPRNRRNHIILVTDMAWPIIKYASARAWSSEGQYGHGVAEGEIKITNPTGGLLKQEWLELGKTNEQNGTWLELKSARVVELRRLKI